MPPRRRTTNLVRKPRVAGLAAARAGGPSAARVASVPPAVVDVGLDAAVTDAAVPVDVGSGPAVADYDLAAAAGPVAVAGNPRRRRLRLTALRDHPVASLAVALAACSALAIGFAVADHVVRATPTAANTALVDVGTTADVLGQVDSALEAVYSYDFTRLDENEKMARAVITPAFADTFGTLFAQVRQLAPQQQAVVSARVTTSAVQSITGDRAVVVAFLDQQATRVNPGAAPQQLNAAGRLTVTAERDGDAWKIADVVNH